MSQDLDDFRYFLYLTANNPAIAGERPEILSYYGGQQGQGADRPERLLYWSSRVH